MTMYMYSVDIIAHYDLKVVASIKKPIPYYSPLLLSSGESH